MQEHALFNFIYASALVAATVATHAAGIFALSWCLIRFEPWASRHFGFFHDTGLSITVIAVHIVLHLVEVAWWSLFYGSRGFFPDQSTAFYFSLTTYSTLGYGDVLLPRESRILGGLEALIGMLMIGWSIAIIVRFASWVAGQRIEVLGKLLTHK
jgi:hypothetical protein